MKRQYQTRSVTNKRNKTSHFPKELDNLILSYIKFHGKLKHTFNFPSNSRTFIDLNNIVVTRKSHDNVEVKVYDVDTFQLKKEILLELVSAYDIYELNNGQLYYRKLNKIIKMDVDSKKTQTTLINPYCAFLIRISDDYIFVHYLDSRVRLYNKKTQRLISTYRLDASTDALKIINGDVWISQHTSLHIIDIKTGELKDTILMDHVKYNKRMFDFPKNINMKACRKFGEGHLKSLHDVVVMNDKLITIPYFDYGVPIYKFVVFDLKTLKFIKEVKFETKNLAYKLTTFGNQLFINTEDNNLVIYH